ncbi:SAM-dependent methyltransferase [Bremerella cremea]|uniref:SAM-dependent methyltransferase n=1 Tax=Bremerella cremea TaxID=1031537 RepID=UPI0031E8EA3B
MDAIIDLFEGLERMSPGSVATTCQAIARATQGRTWRSLVEFGCGRGISTMLLAEETFAKITAIDTCGAFLQQLQVEAASRGYADRVHIRQQSMDTTWPRGTSFDAVWCEGSVYSIGLENALRLWHPLLRPGGVLAVSDLVWLTDSPDAEVDAYWKREGVALRSRGEVEQLLPEHGFRLLSSFVFPDSDWQNYYGPISERLATWVDSYADRKEAELVAAAFEEEMAMYSRFGQQYGYVFFLAEV